MHLLVFLRDKYANLELLGIDCINFRPTLRMFIVDRPPYIDRNALTYARRLTECLSYYSLKGGNLPKGGNLTPPLARLSQRVSNIC